MVVTATGNNDDVARCEITPLLSCFLEQPEEQSPVQEAAATTATGSTSSTPHDNNDGCNNSNCLALAPWPFNTLTDEAAAVVFLVVACVAALLQDSHEVLPILTLLQPTCWLGFAICTTMSTNQRIRRYRYGYFWAGWFLIVLLRAVPASDYFLIHTTRGAAYGAALAVILMNHVCVAAAVLVQVSMWQQHPEQPPTCSRVIRGAAVAPFGLAILLTALVQLLLRFSPVGGVGNPAMGLARLPGIRQIASLGGEVSLLFCMMWTGTLLAGSLQAKTTRRQGIIWTIIMSLLMVYGCFREGVGLGLYMQDIETWPLANVPRIQVSCITRNSSTLGKKTMLERTHERLRAGDDLILWSEFAIVTPIQLGDLDWSVATNPNSVVATTFSRPVPGRLLDKSYNVIALWNATGLVSEYTKNRPVPLVENYIAPGTIQPTPEMVTFAPLMSEYGERRLVQRKIATAICFDLDFDYLSRHAAKADIMVGPSWYWASIGPSLWYHNTFRAIENGFHLIKCSEDGISGHVDTRGRTMTAIPTLGGQVYNWQVPLTKGITTVYSLFGYMFGWVCVGLAPFLLLLHAFGCHGRCFHATAPVPQPL